MHVSIDHYEKELRFGGWFGPRHRFFFVSVEVTFSELEKYTIDELALERMPLVVRNAPAHIDPREVDEMDDRFSLYVGDLVKGPDEYSFFIPAEANEYEDHLEQALQGFAMHIKDNLGKRGKRRTFEL